MVHHEDIEDTSREELESGHSGSRRTRAWRRGTTEQGCDERLKTKIEGSTRLPYTRLCGGLEHLKKETRLID